MTSDRCARRPVKELMVWRGALKMARQARYQWDGNNERGLVMASALLALEPKAATIWSSLFLLLRVGGPNDWERALHHVPPDGGLVRLAGVVRAYEDRAARGHFKPLTSAQVADFPALVEGMLAVADNPGAYLDAVAKEWFDHPTQVFGEHTRRRMAGKLRGLLGERKYTDDKRPQVSVD